MALKKITILLLVVFCAITVLQSCSTLCPAYSTYPEGKKKRP